MKRYLSSKSLSFLLLLVGFVSLSLVSLPGKTFAEGFAPEKAGIIRDKTGQGIAYMMGGVGIRERELMESSAADYNVKLAFAEKVGVYLASVDVTVADQKGNEIASLTTNGPWLYLQLPPGSYTVKAAFNSETRQIKNLRVPSDGRVARLMRWDLQEEFPIYARMERGQP